MRRGGADRPSRVRFTPEKTEWVGEGKEGAGGGREGERKGKRRGEGERKRRDRGRRRGALPPEVGRRRTSQQHLPEGHSPSDPGGPVRARGGGLGKRYPVQRVRLRGPRDRDPATPPAPVPARGRGGPWRPGAALAGMPPALRGRPLPGAPACAGPRRPAPGRAGQIAGKGPSCGAGAPMRGQRRRRGGPSGARGPLQGSHSSGHVAGKPVRFPAPRAPSAMRGAGPSGWYRETGREEMGV